MPRGVYDRIKIKPVTVKGNTAKGSVVPDDLKEYVYDMPEFLKTLTTATKRSVAITKMAEALKAVPKNKCLVYTVVQLEEILGHQISNLKKTGAGIRAKLKACGIERPRCVPDGGRLFIFRNDLT